MGLCVGEQRLRSRSPPFLRLSRSVGDMVADIRPGIVTEFVTSAYPARISAHAHRGCRGVTSMAADATDVANSSPEVSSRRLVPLTARHEATKSYGGFVTISRRSPRILRREQGAAALAKRIMAETAGSRLRSMDMLVGRDIWLTASRRLRRTIR